MSVISLDGSVDKTPVLPAALQASASPLCDGSQHGWSGLCSEQCPPEGPRVPVNTVLHSPL